MTVPGPGGPAVQPGKPTRKVVFATIGSWVLGALALLIVDITKSDQLYILTKDLPGWANAVIVPLFPALGALAAGYVAKHGPNDVLLPVLGRLVRRSTS